MAIRIVSRRVGADGVPDAPIPLTLKFTSVSEARDEALGISQRHVKHGYDPEQGWWWYEDIGAVVRLTVENQIELEDQLIQYDELARDVARSNSKFLQGNLSRWFSFLDSAPPFARPILQKLESNVDFTVWYTPYRMASMGHGTKAIEWPSELHKRLGIQLLFFREIAKNGIDPKTFALTLLNRSNVEDGNRDIVEQIFIPMSNELRRYLKLEVETAASNSSAVTNVYQVDSGNSPETLPDITPLVIGQRNQEAANVVPLAARVTTQSSGRGTLTLLPGNWDAERQQALERITQIEVALTELRSFARQLDAAHRDDSAAGIGHNRPPEAIDSGSSEATVNLGIEVAKALQSELGSDKPNFRFIALCGTAFEVVRKWAVGVCRWIADTGKKGASAAVVTFGGAEGVKYAPDLDRLIRNLPTVIEQMGHWVKLVLP